MIYGGLKYQLMYNYHIPEAEMGSNSASGRYGRIIVWSQPLGTLGPAAAAGGSNRHQKTINLFPADITTHISSL